MNNCGRNLNIMQRQLRTKKEVDSVNLKSYPFNIHICDLISAEDGVKAPLVLGTRVKTAAVAQ